MSRMLVNDVFLNVTELPAIGRQRPGGAGTPIVMIHGLAASSAFWQLSGAPILARLGPVLLYDLRGHGKSDTPAGGYGIGTMAEDLAAILDAREIGRAHLVAHSFGGMIALLFALRSPERVASLSLVDVRVRPLQTALSIQRAAVNPAVARRLAALGMDADRVARPEDGIDYLTTIARIQVAADDEADEILGALYNHPRLFRSRRNAERWLRFVETASLVADLARETTFGPQDLRRLTQPMLVMAGEQSPTLQSARAMARLCPGAVLRVIPDVGHFFAISRPELFLKPTVRFLRAVNRGDPRLSAKPATTAALGAGRVSRSPIGSTG